MSTRKLTYNWSMAKQRHRTAERNVTEAKNREREAENKLGKHLDPGDQKDGERITVWCAFEADEESLVCSTRHGQDYEISLRGTRKSK